MNGKIIPYITEANGNLSNQKAMILDAIKKAEKNTFSLFGIDWDIDVLITNNMPEMLIPEDGISGNTYTDSFIVLSIDEEKVDSDKITEMLCHEICHAARWGKNSEWCNNVFDLLILEGLATYFESIVVKNSHSKTFFIDTILNRSDKENEKILQELQPHLNDTDFDGRKILVSPTKTLPRWSGYSLGYYLVKKYLEQTGKKIEDVFAEKYDIFRKALQL